MTAQLRSEIVKARTTRTAALLLAAAAALTLLGTCLEGLSPTHAELAAEHAQRTMLGANVSAVFVATFAGLLGVTGEFRYGTVRPTLLFEPRRDVVLGAKLVVAGLTGAVFAAVCTLVSFAAGLAILTVRDAGWALTTTHALTLILGTAGSSVLGAMIGVAVGTLVRNQAGAIATVVAYAFIVDALVFGAVPAVGRYLPGKAGDALAGQPVDQLLSPGVGGAILACWALALIGAAAVRGRGDV